MFQKFPENKKYFKRFYSYRHMTLFLIKPLFHVLLFILFDRLLISHKMT